MMIAANADAAVVLFSGGQDSAVCLAAFVDLLVEATHTCYLGDRSHRHDWGYGCGERPARRLRANGFANWKATR